MDGASEKDFLNGKAWNVVEAERQLKKKAGEANGIGDTAAY